jgi:hypothetical protein
VLRKDGETGRQAAETGAVSAYIRGGAISITYELLGVYGEGAFLRYTGSVLCV